MDIIGMIFLIILALCALAAISFFTGPTIIKWVAYLAMIAEDKAEEWRELIEAGKGDR